MSSSIQRIGRGLVWVLTALTKLATAKQQAALATIAGSALFLFFWPLAGGVASIGALYLIGYLTESQPNDPNSH